MAEPSTHINYSFEDIQRYLQGKMSAAEMHKIEKAALQDSFLADAIEGYKEVDRNLAQQHLNEINATLISDHKQSKLVAFNKKTKWLRVVALVIIITGIGIMGAYIFKTSNKQQQVAQLKKEEINTNLPAKDSAVQQLNEQNKLHDTQSTITQKNDQAVIASLTKKEIKNKLTSTHINADETSSITTMKAFSQNKNDSMLLASASPSQQNEDSVPDILPRRISGISIAPTIFSGKVTDEKNQPVAGVIVEATDKSITVLTDNNGDFRLFKSDTILNATAGTIGYENKTIVLQPGDNNVIILKQNNITMNEVVVVSSNSKKLKPVNQTATPVGGWQNFNNYVLNKLNKDSSNNNFMTANDEVEMEFLIDGEGNPYNIKITKPLDEQHNSKAIEILKGGPKWTTASKTKKAKVSISF